MWHLVFPASSVELLLFLKTDYVPWDTAFNISQISIGMPRGFECHIIVFILSKQTTIWKFWNSVSSNRHLELHRRCCLCTRFIHRFNQFKEENSVISWVSKTPAIKILWLVHTWSGICFLLVFREARRARLGFMSSQLSLGQTNGWYWRSYFLAWSMVQKLMILRQLSLS